MHMLSGKDGTLCGLSSLNVSLTNSWAMVTCRHCLKVRERE